MLPIYISYFAGGKERSSKKTIINATGFILGFTVIFILLGTLAGTLGSFLSKYQIALNIITGLIVIFFGLNFIGVFKLNIFKGTNVKIKDDMGFISSLIFGFVFSIGWTPCVGAFLGSALMLASQQGTALKGLLMLLCYSLGLGIPFMISALLIDKLKTTFNFIKRNYKIINIISGSLLILVGILMMTGSLGILLNLLN